jgi:thioredoxin reductase (NADPH)
MVFVSAPKRSRSELAARLGAERDDDGYVVTDGEGRTSVPGLFAAGDVTAGHAHQVTTAAHQGATAATAVNYVLYDEVERGEG